MQIGCNVKCKFKKVQYTSGTSAKGPYVKLTFVFWSDDGIFKHEDWQPTLSTSIESYIEAINFAERLKPLLDKLSPNVWDTLPQSSWEEFYTNYIAELNKHYNKIVYIKTIPKYGSKGEVYAQLAKTNWISLNPDLEYSILELSAMDDYDNEDFQPLNKDKVIAPPPVDRPQEISKFKVDPNEMDIIF